MNRRDLLKRGPLALLGICGVVLGVKAAPQEKEITRIVLHEDSKAFQDAVMKTVTEHARAYSPFLMDIRGR